MEKLWRFPLTCIDCLQKHKIIFFFFFFKGFSYGYINDIFAELDKVWSLLQIIFT